MPNAKTIISCAMTGGSTPKDKCPALPITPEEIAEDVYRVWKAGASVVHMHMRDENAKATLDTERFKRTVELIRAHEDCDVIINCTSSSANTGADHSARFRHFRAIPDIEVGSVDIGSFNYGCRYLFDNNPQFLEELMGCLQECDVLPEVEIFDSGMIGNLKHYMSKGLIKAPAWCQIVMNILGGAQPTVESLAYLVRQLPEGTNWSCTGIGPAHLPMMYATLALGGHVRVGLEDNIYYAKGRPATNVELVEWAVRVVTEFGNEVATPAEAREILGIKPLRR